MGLQTEMWAKEIREKLLPDNMFCVKGINDSAWVDNKKVHLAGAGAFPNVVVNRSDYPVPVSKRTDVPQEYSIDEYSTNATHVPDIEKTELSYDKRQSVISGHVRQLNEKIAQQMAYNWATDTNIIRTTGDAVAATSAGATGQRKAITLKDIVRARAMMDKMNVPQADRYLLMQSDLYNQLLEIDKVLNADYANRGKLPDGVVNKLFGFNVMVRSATVRYTAAGNRRAVSSANAAADCSAVLAWHKDWVRYAKGGVKLFYDNNTPTYQGDVISALARMGGIKYSTNDTGVVAIVEDNAA